MKEAKTQFEVNDLIKNRWSPRSFSSQAISKQDLHTLVEAGTWAFSAGNRQPWKFITALNGSNSFELILAALADGNKTWADKAAGFIIAVAEVLDEKQEPISYAEFAVGAASATMALQALTMQLYVHPMAGFDAPQISIDFSLPNTLKPMVVIAVGCLGEAEKLSDSLAARERAERSRKPVNEVILSF